MKKTFLLLVACVILAVTQGCTKYNLIDTGEANGNHNTTMWGYFATDSYNWSLLMEMITHAEMQDYFDGGRGTNFTFFGPTNHSIRRYLLENDLEKVTDIPKDVCRTMLLDCLLGERKFLIDFKVGRPSVDTEQIIGTGGELLKMASGKELWVYTFKGTFNEIPEAGPEQIYLVSEATQKRTVVASSNITTLTGVVHSLDYSFTLNDF